MNTRVQPNLPGAALIVFVALIILLVPWLGETLFYSKGEPREAIVAMSMLSSGEWILPVNYGVDIPFKPPFLGWLIALFAMVFNGGEVNEFIARLPSAIAAIAMVMCGYSWARRERGERFAIIFSFVTICSFEVFRAALACRLDMVLTACEVCAIYMMYNIREHAPRYKGLRYAIVIVLLTCATLTKGPVGSFLPCMVMGVYCLLRGDRFFPTLTRMLTIAIASCLLPAWWFWEAYKIGGDQFFDLMMEENIGRLTGTMSYESHENPFWYNFMTLLAGLLPWTVFLLMALFALRGVRREPLRPAGLLCLTVAVLVVGFFCIPASKRSVYLLPAYPFICYGIANALDYRKSWKPVQIFTWLMAVLAIAAPFAIIALQIWPLPKLPVETIPWWRYIILALPLAAGVAWIVNRHSPVGHLCVIVWAMYLSYVAVGMPAVLNPKSDSQVLGQLEAAGKQSTIYSVGEYRLYSLNYYLGDRLRMVPDFATASQLPRGTVVLYTEGTDTTGLSAAFESRVLTSRGADYRKPVYIATRK